LHAKALDFGILYGINCLPKDTIVNSNCPKGFWLRLFFNLILLIQLFMLFAPTAFCVGDPVVDSIVIRGVNEIHNEKFLDAVATFKTMIPLRPGTPMPYFYIAATYLALISEYRNPEYRDEFEAYIDSAVAIGEKKAETEFGTDEDYFYYGGALGYRGIYKSEKGDWWGAFKDGARARGKLERALVIDSTNYDVYFGLGAYDYWRSVKTKTFWWLPFFGDKRQAGIKEVWIAAEKGKYSQIESKYALIRIYHEDRNWKAMFDLWFGKLETVNPNDPFSLWWLSDGYAQLGQWANSENAYGQLLKTILASPFYHPNAELELRYNIAFAQNRQNKSREAIDNLKQAISLNDRIIDFGSTPEFLKKSKELLNQIDKTIDYSH